MDNYEIIKKLWERDLNKPENLRLLFDMAVNTEDYELCGKIKAEAVSKARFWLYEKPRLSIEFRDIYGECLKFEAPKIFDSFLIYNELKRESGKRFYHPRRKQLKPIAEQMQRLADDELDLLAVSMPPGTGKTTLAVMFIAWLAGRNPDSPILAGSHNNSFLRGLYDEFLRIFDKDGEYSWNEVFPAASIEKTNAQDLKINLGSPKRFTSIQMSSVDSGNAGKVRAEQLLYCDDLVSGIEEAMSRERMDGLFQKYATDLRQRKIGKCKELHIATRWSVHDVIGKLEQAYGDDPRARFIVVPALNEDDESSFDYPIEAGFTTEFYHKQREIMDDVSWRALYMNKPIEREGLLYNADELRRFFETPDRDPDGIISICDTKDKGTDYAFMPVAEIYGNDYYITDCICDNNLPDIVEPRIVEMLKRKKVQMSRFESNSAGGRIAKEIQEQVKGITKITTKYTTANKETKIILNSGWVKEHCLFKDESLYKKRDDYGKMIEMLCGYTMAGKNKHDDVPDGMAMLAEFSKSLSGNQVQIFQRFF